MDECECQNITRLDVPDKGAVWLCRWCGAQYVPKTAVDYKIAYLTCELGRRMVDEQGSGVREQGTVRHS